MRRGLPLALLCGGLLAGCDRSPTVPIAPESQSPVSSIELAPGTCPAPGALTVTSLHPEGAIESRALAINDRGEVLVVSDVGNFVWSETSGYVEVPIDFPQAINDAGLVVGWNGEAFLDRQAVLWSAGGGLQLLPSPKGYEASFASDINDAGVIVGGAWGPPPVTAPFPEVPEETFVPIAWTSGTPQLLSLGSLEFFLDLIGAEAINDNGAVIGNGTAESFGFSLYWEAPLEGGDPEFVIVPGADGGDLTDINAAGTATGTSVSFFGEYDAYIWTSATGFQDLTPGPESGAANAINDLGMVVGHIAHPTSELFEFGPLIPIRWTATGGIEELPLPSGGTSGEALDINELGYIVGEVDGHAVLWSPGGSPITAVEEIGILVRELGESGQLDDSQAHMLLVTLDVARNHLEEGRTTAAHGALGALANQLEALIRSGALALTEGEDLRNRVLCVMERV